jgi:hypothetical protein
VSASEKTKVLERDGVRTPPETNEIIEAALNEALRRIAKDGHGDAILRDVSDCEGGGASIRRWYLRLFREPDDGTDWPIINANLKFATFLIYVAVVILVAILIVKIICGIR